MTRKRIVTVAAFALILILAAVILNTRHARHADATGMDNLRLIDSSGSMRGVHQGYVLNEEADARTGRHGARGKAGEGGQLDAVVAQLGQTVHDLQTPATSVTTNRKIITTATLTLRVERPEQAVEQIRQLVEAQGGHVSHVSITNQSGDRFGATVQLRVDARKFDAVLKSAKGLATEVVQETLGTQDVTEQFTDVAARLENLKRAEEELRKLLEETRQRSGKLEDVMAVFRELTAMRGQIESLQGQLNVLSDRVDLATIDVSLIGPTVSVATIDTTWSAGSTFLAATRTLTEALQWIAGALIYLGVTVLPLAVLVVLPLWLIWKIVRRGRAPAVTA